MCNVYTWQHWTSLQRLPVQASIPKTITNILLQLNPHQRNRLLLRTKPPGSWTLSVSHCRDPSQRHRVHLPALLMSPLRCWRFLIYVCVYVYVCACFLVCVHVYLCCLFLFFVFVYCFVCRMKLCQLLNHQSTPMKPFPPPHKTTRKLDAICVSLP